MRLPSLVIDHLEVTHLSVEIAALCIFAIQCQPHLQRPSAKLLMADISSKTPQWDVYIVHQALEGKFSYHKLQQLIILLPCQTPG